MPTPARGDQLVESHEDRIQRLESEIPELTSQVTTVVLQQRALGEKMDNLLCAVEGSSTKLDVLQARLVPLEETKKRFEWTKTALGKALLPLALLFTAALGAWGERLANWISQ